MNYVLLTIWPVLLIILTFCGSVLSKDGSLNTDFMSSRQTRLIQTAACIGVILHHVTQRITSYGILKKGPVTLLNYTGFLFTALFFFISGYGLLTSLQTKPDYLSDFLIKRLPNVLIPFWVVNGLGVLFRRFVYQIHTTPAGIFRSIFGITLINGNGWFIIEIVIFYLLFYILFRLIRNRDIALVLLCAGVIAVIRYSFLQGHDTGGKLIQWFHGEWWYNSTVTFIPGLLFARFRERITSFMQKRYRFLLPAAVVLSAAALNVSILFVIRYGYYQTYPSFFGHNAAFTLLTQMISCITFTLLVVLLQMRIRLGNRVLEYLSSISRELFLIHGYIVIWIFDFIKMSDFMRYVCVLSGSIACTAILSPMICWITRRTIGVLHDIRRYRQAARRAKIEERGRRDSKLLKKRRTVLLICVPVVLLSVFIGRIIMVRMEFEKECRVLGSSSVGDIVYWGHYETDPSHIGREHLPWIVIDKEGDQFCLMTQDGIAGGYYHQRHEAVSWEDCDMRRNLNSDAFTGMFSKYEMSCLVPKDGDMISLLTVPQARNLFHTDEDRIMMVTEAAIKQGVNVDLVSHDDIWFDQFYCFSWWWLRGENGEKSITAPNVEMNGTIFTDKRTVNRPSGAIRPVIWVDPA